MAHSSIGPSSAKRWRNCPGSVGLSAKLPKPPTSEAAAEGTVAHSLAEEYVTGAIDSLELMAQVGNIVKCEGHEIEIIEEMVDGAIEYADLIKADRGRMEADAKPMKVIGQAEVRVCASSVDPELWGTADYILYRRGDVLVVYDYKFGKGVIVDPEENDQAAIYAIAVMDDESRSSSKSTSRAAITSTGRSGSGRRRLPGSRASAMGSKGKWRRRATPMRRSRPATGAGGVRPRRSARPCSRRRRSRGAPTSPW